MRGAVFQIIPGMFAMSFEDDNGDRLSVPGEISFSYPLDQLSNDTNLEDIRVWTMNPNTGMYGWFTHFAK